MDDDATQVKEIYFGVFARVIDGRVTGFYMDQETLIGSFDGHVWDENAQEWTTEEPECDRNPYILLREIIDGINNGLAVGA